MLRNLSKMIHDPFRFALMNIISFILLTKLTKMFKSLFTSRCKYSSQLCACVNRISQLHNRIRKKHILIEQKHWKPSKPQNISHPYLQTQTTLFNQTPIPPDLLLEKDDTKTTFV